MKRFRVIVLFVIFSSALTAQENVLSLQLSNILFKDLADTVEKIVPVKIYYSDRWVDSLYLNIDSKEESIDDIFEKSLENSG